MQEKQQHIKIPPAWKADEWICHHSGSRPSTFLDNYSYRQSKGKSLSSSRHFDSPSPPKRISTAKLRRQIENLSLKSADLRLSARKSKVKRLTDTLSPKSYKSFLTCTSRRALTPAIRIPKMSKQSLKRWLDARDAYLGHQHPYIQERSKRHRSPHRRRTKSSKDHHQQMIDYDEAVSILSANSSRVHIPKEVSSEKARRSSRIKPISRSELNLRRSGRSLLERIKSFVQAPVRSLSRLSQCRQLKRTEIIHDHFDDKCVGREISIRTRLQTHVSRNDQGVQVDLARPQIELHHEYDTSMVVGERKQRTRSVRRHVEFSDRATETDFPFKHVNVEEERREDDKAICRGKEKEKRDPYINPSHVQQEQAQLPTMTTRTNEDPPPPKLTHTGNRIVPLTDLFQTSINDDHENIDKHNGSCTTTESNISVQEQLQRLRVRFNRLSKERRLLTCLLIFFAIVMCGLLIGIFILSLTFHGRTSILSRERNATHIGASEGVFEQKLSAVTEVNSTLSANIPLRTTFTTITSTSKPFARYGESCENDNGCERPFICHKKGSTTPGMCRCPLKYDFVKDRCVGDLNALCTKDSDCQRYMHCSTVKDGTQQCQCQTQFNYDNDRRRCRGDYHAPCENSMDCHANLICNKTASPSFCSCESHYQYHSSQRKCRGDPGAVCAEPTAECVDNAECRDGACECSNQFVPDEHRICVDPCPKHVPNPARIRYPGNCRRFIDCQQKSKTECPEMTIFNLRTQLCDYPKNVFDCG